MKVKFKHLGEQQRSVFYGYNKPNGRYEDLEYQPTVIDFEEIINVKKLDYSNWLSKDKKELPEKIETAMTENLNFENEEPDLTDIPF